MTKKKFSKKIIIYELVGFGIITLFLWLDEILDIPHLFFGAKATPINITESVFETIAILCLCAVILFFTFRILKKIKYLEGFLAVCIYCKKVRVLNDWVEIEDYIKEHSEAECRESMCPECLSKYHGDAIWS